MSCDLNHEPNSNAKNNDNNSKKKITNKIYTTKIETGRRGNDNNNTLDWAADMFEAYQN